MTHSASRNRRIEQNIIMNLAKRAFLSTRGSLGKTVILLLITLVLGCAISGAISVRQAIQHANINLRNNMSAAVTVEVDFVAMQEYEMKIGSWPEVELLPAELYSEIGDLPYVRNYDFSAWVALQSSRLERYIVNEYLIAYEELGEWRTFNLKGVHSTSLLDIEEGLIEISFGRMFTQNEVDNLSYVVLVSDNFAQINNLHIGSTISLENIVWKEGGFEAGSFTNEDIYAVRSYDFEVVGIFTPLVEFDSGDGWTDEIFQEQVENRIYVPNPVAIAGQIFQLNHMKEIMPENEHLQGDIEDLLFHQNVYVLNDPFVIEDFRQAVEDMTPEFWTVTDAGSKYEGVNSSLDFLNDIALGVLVAAIVATLIVLSLIITLFLRDRKHEIGIYLALGERKVKVIFQLLLEVLMITSAAILLSLLIGNQLASGISESMLRNSMLAQQAEDGFMQFSVLDMMGFAGGQASVEDALMNYNVALDMPTIAIFLVVAVLTIVMATIIPMLFIVNLDPRKILM